MWMSFYAEKALKLLALKYNSVRIQFQDNWFCVEIESFCTMSSALRLIKFQYQSMRNH